MGAAARASGPSRHSIGHVLAMLREEFPDLSHSKLHYLEAEGLVRPARTASGYRKYSEEDVDRLQFVLRAQRDRFWPLKVIKEHLEQRDAEGTAITSIAAARPGPSAQLAPVRLDRAGLRRETRADEAFLIELDQYGLLPRGAERYGQGEVDVVRAALVLAAEGLHPRHLVMLRSAAEREAHLIGSVAQPRTRAHSSISRGEGESLSSELTEAVNSLHNALLRRSVGHG